MYREFKLKILYEDNHLISVIKPPGILSQGDKTGDRDIAYFVKKYLKEKYSKKGNVYLGHIHRLDRVVGGVMLFAKTSKAASRISDEMRRNLVEKEYLLTTKGEIKNKKGKLVHYLYRDREKNQVTALDEKSEGLKEAVLEYEVLEEKNNFSLVKVNLHTGRHHQIRAQFKKIGYPIIGDVKYGEKEKLKYPALWSYSIEFTHPTKKNKTKIKSNPPNQYPWNIFEYLKK